MSGPSPSGLIEPQELLRGVGRTPLPDGCTAPMLATLGSMPPMPELFGYEVKWDGYRVLARWDQRKLLLCSRNGIDLSGHFAEVTPLARALRRAVLLDGEMVAMGKGGRPSFSALQARMPRPRGTPSGRVWDAESYRIQYMIFDVLHYAGKSSCGLPYTERRAILDSLALSGPAWQVPPMHPDGQELLAVMRQTGQEGVIAKRLTSRYLCGRRSPDWIKIKVNRSDEFLVVGFWSSGRHRLGSLLLGTYLSAADARAGRNLQFCGKVGTGFSEAARHQLEQALRALAVADPQVVGDLPPRRGITWCRARLVAQIRYAEWTHEGALRHPVFVGLRSDKRPHEVVHPHTER